MKKDVIKGLIIGIIAPIVSLPLVLWFSAILHLSEYTLSNPPAYYEVSLMIQEISRNQLPGVISLCLLINLIIFLINMNRKRDNQAKGTLFATFLYGVIIITLKFI